MTDDFAKYGFPDGKRYNSFVGYFKRKYGERLQKIVLDAGFTCPNRDGKVGRGGCTYCDNAAFHPSYSTAGKSLHQQMDEGIEFHKVRYRTTEHYLAYFQSFSNTYAPLERLKALYEEALSHPQVVGIVIGTRPDCVDEEKLDYLADLAGGRVLEGWSRSLSDGQERTAPVVIVEYDRIPYVYKNGNVRITLDTNICSSSAVSTFLEETIPRRPVLPLGQQLLEVKYDEYLPDFIYRSLQLSSLRQTAFSKYYICRKYTR